MEKEHLLLGIGGTLARRLLRLDSLRPGDMVNKHSQLPLAHVKNVCVCVRWSFGLRFSPVFMVFYSISWCKSKLWEKNHIWCIATYLSLQEVPCLLALWQGIASTQRSQNSLADLSLLHPTPNIQEIFICKLSWKFLWSHFSHGDD